MPDLPENLRQERESLADIITAKTARLREISDEVSLDTIKTLGDRRQLSAEIMDAQNEIIRNAVQIVVDMERAMNDQEQ